MVVDMEHGINETTVALSIVQALASRNALSIKQLPVNNQVKVNKSLDIGPAGIMFRMVHNIEPACLMYSEILSVCSSLQLQLFEHHAMV